MEKEFEGWFVGIGKRKKMEASKIRGKRKLWNIRTEFWQKVQWKTEWGQIPQGPLVSPADSGGWAGGAKDWLCLCFTGFQISGFLSVTAHWLSPDSEARRTFLLPHLDDVLLVIALELEPLQGCNVYWFNPGNLGRLSRIQAVSCSGYKVVVVQWEGQQPPDHHRGPLHQGPKGLSGCSSKQKYWDFTQWLIY